MKPYYEGGGIQLWHGDMREILPTLGDFEACVTDPPYQETSLKWDRWVDGWPALVAEHTRSLWCFGSMRMFPRPCRRVRWVAAVAGRGVGEAQRIRPKRGPLPSSARAGVALVPGSVGFDPQGCAANTGG